MSFMDSPTAFIRKEIVDALDEAQDSGATVEVHPRAASPRRPLLTSKSFEDPRKLPAPPAPPEDDASTVASLRPPQIEQGLSNISSLTSAEIDDPELLILASKTAPPPFLEKQAARRASAPAESLTDLAAAARQIAAAKQQRPVAKRRFVPLVTFALGALLATAAFFWSPAVDLVLPRVALSDANVQAPKPKCVDEACGVWAHPLRIGAFSPLVIRPAPGADTSPRALVAFLDGHKRWARDRLESEGALLFRGFQVTNASDFESVAVSLEPGQLATTYEGTSPRTSLSPHVKTAADLPPTSVVPAHAEMSFAPRPPARLWRLGADEDDLLIVQGNLANTYKQLERVEEALRLRRDVYSGRLKLSGDEHFSTLVAAYNYATSLEDLKRFEDARSLLRRTIPVARRVVGEGDGLTLKMRWNYAETLYKDEVATLEDLSEAVTTLEELERTARRVFGGAHPLTGGIDDELRDARAALGARETPSPGSA